jgi:hypothetical protein
MKNKLIVIGWMGVKTAYLNVPEEEALRRWLQSNSATREDIEDFDFVQEFDFEDEFGVYDAWDL